MEAEEQIQRVTEQIVSSDRGSDRIETMEEIRQLGKVTATAGAMTLENVEDEPVAALARRMRQCWISTIGYKISERMDQLGSLCKVGLEALYLINDDDVPHSFTQANGGPTTACVAAGA